MCSSSLVLVVDRLDGRPVAPFVVFVGYVDSFVVLVCRPMLGTVSIVCVVLVVLVRRRPMQGTVSLERSVVRLLHTGGA